MLLLWLAILKELKLDEQIMPQDISTCCNSTYDMLKFALNSCIALDTITGERDMKLWKYELNDEEWTIARQLGDTLEVCSFILFMTTLLRTHIAIKTCHSLLFLSDTQHRDSNPCHGPS